MEEIKNLSLKDYNQIEYLVCELDPKTSNYWVNKEFDKLEAAEVWLDIATKQHPKQAWCILKKNVQFATIKTVHPKKPSVEFFSSLGQYVDLTGHKPEFVIQYLRLLINNLESIPEVADALQKESQTLQADIKVLEKEQAVCQSHETIRPRPFTYKMNAQTCRYEKEEI